MIRSKRGISTLLSLLAACSTVASATPYVYNDYDSMVAALTVLEANHPDLVEVFTAQDAFGLGIDDDAGTPLSHWIVRLTNEATGFDKPEVLLVGVQHGDEVVGLEVLLALMDLVTDSYGSHPWLTELLDRREIYVVPLANPWGHAQAPQRRWSPGSEDNQTVGTEDMNRDHPYDRCDSFCSDEVTLSTNGARAIHELARRHLFRVMLDYHGGIELILHPWGSPLHVGNSESPDATAHDQLGLRMRQYGGSFSGLTPVGTANDLLGPANGPLDDTGYAASWDTGNADGAWPVGAWQALAYTIEISNDKRPPVATLGGDADLLTTDGLEDGYVPKHLRMGLAAIDIAEPYVVWTNRGDLPTTVGVGQPVTVEWQVRGCFDVDETRVRAGNDPDPLNTFSIETATQSQTSGEPCFEPPTTFSAQLSFDTVGVWWLTPTARVDQALLAQNNPSPSVAPQSFVVRSRTEVGLIASETDVDPLEENSVVGQLDWGAQSLMIEVVLGDIFGDGFESGDTTSWSASVQ